MKTGFLVLENGETWQGDFLGGEPKAGEVVFNTSHAGYEEMATDPSYFSQILVTTAPQQGNYGADRSVWESESLWIQGFVCLEMQKTKRDRSWLDRLVNSKIPVLENIDTRSVTLHLREQGTQWGAVVVADNPVEAQKIARDLILKQKELPKDWTQLVCRKSPQILKGINPKGPKVALIDFGCKENIIRELLSRCKEVKVFPSMTSADEIKAWSPDGIFLSNGPGDPDQVEVGTETVKQLLGYKSIFGICMGHQVLARAMGGRTYKLKFGHRGSNHPIQDRILNKIYVTSQNHGYNVDLESLPSGVEVTHINLNDKTVAGIRWKEKNCMSVQFHPESHPGPHEAVELFDVFAQGLQ